MSNLPEAGIYVYNLEVASRNEEVERIMESDDWWEFNVSDQFPIKSVKKINEKVDIKVGDPHEGCIIRTTLKNQKLNGTANIYSHDNSLMATLTFVDGIASGPCSIYKNENLFFQGYFIDGYRAGRGKEYDEHGELIFDGFYKEGRKLNILPSTEMGKGYWKEIDKNGRISQICQKDELGNTEGFVYSFVSGQISRISLWKDGKEVTLLKLFKNDTMTEYKNGKIVYEGGFLDSLEMGYPRNGEGTGRRKDDETGRLEDNFMSHNKKISKAERFCRSVLENRYLSIIAAVIAIIAFLYYFGKIYLNSGLHGIGYYQESYRVESGYGKYVAFFSLHNYPNLKYIEIGDNCFPSVKLFEIDSAKSLKSLTIGSHSFYPTSYDSLYHSKSFYILNCESLESIEIGEFSFYDFWGDFELKNLPNLHSCKIGKIEVDSRNFYKVSFDIEGNLLIIHVINTIDLPNLSTLLLGSESFTNTNLNFSNFYDYESIELGDSHIQKSTSFYLNGYQKLRTLRLGYCRINQEDQYTTSNSLMSTDNGYTRNEAYSFQILNSESLEIIEIGSNTFPDFAGGFELKNLPSLVSLIIGPNNFQSMKHFSIASNTLIIYILMQ